MPGSTPAIPMIMLMHLCIGKYNCILESEDF